ncbi:SDR family oxidoreductase [Pseudomonas sp. 10B1]|uniref:SDR family NAD(P)-dependent oxidoreductase n=1 Tax=unclassified Pseudomonas TaxID=196821 RepID=UPI002AB55A05|nr:MULTISPECIES: SDR family oxidoreductase [unclassified Pseudomonas]MDY7560697.1 SDR family oxidoreductase [Pseudomonas sp. AB6]MEA9979534.1 SDR family oxidoreductase [Pseudomonas sp. RTS4]MEA9996065.1 SDR family oxidoreductase [Pseudomonas sp. AA4]MEB0087388.1 SDR family oxidoreductase [Pseudomonas sp. RTI1]MEB0127960.1 SDR family oxidoreductase [Pseudomonas sp. CCC1.2]
MSEYIEKQTGKIAIITGGSRGIGRNTLLCLAKRGVTSIFTYKSNRGEADQVVALAAKAGAKAIALHLDVGNAQSFAAFAKDVQIALAELGADRFDYLVNNAGTSSNSSFAQTTEAELDSLFAVHFKGAFLLTQTLVPLMNDGGRIINISSGLARFAMPNRAAYGSIKAAVESLTRYMAVELASRRISANVVAPGAIATDFSGGIVRDNPEVNKAVASHTALGRAGEPQDVGPVIAGLLSDEFGWVNAQRIEVAGGVHI